MTRFLVCLDGTWNNAASEVERLESNEPLYRPSNVLKVARAATLPGQITYYDAGVGAMNRAPSGAGRILKKVDNVLGGALGAGFEVNIEEAYSFLANNWTAGDELLVFGFSRGAAQARSLVRFIEWVGGFPQKSDVYYVPRLFSDYLERFGEGSGKDFWTAKSDQRVQRGDRPLDPIVPAKIPLLAVWDTVLAIGTRFMTRSDETAKRVDFHTSPRPPTSVARVVHALAIDERRHDFRAEIFDAPNSDELEQRWFPGAHSNVGGGLAEDSLANAALHWFVQEAEAKGAVFDANFLSHFTANAARPASQKSKGYRLLDGVLKPFRGYEGERDLLATDSMSIDDSVLDRLKQNADYRPANLIRFIRARTDLHGDPRISPFV